MENVNTFIGAPTEDELMHYGRKGMKWGQNIFGKKLSSLKKRKGDSDSDDGEPNKPKKKSVKEMSDTELQREINRLQMEQRYAQLTPEQMSKGRKFASTIGNDVLKPALINASKNVVQDYATKVAKDALGLNTKSDLDILKGKNDRMRAEKEYIELTEFLKKNKK
jgi:hypothetical protein